VLSAIKHPVTLAPNPTQGYTPKPSLIADLCNRYHQVVSVTLNGFDGDAYFIDLKDGNQPRRRDERPLAGAPHAGLGATGLSCNQTNVIPKTVRRYVDHYERGELAGANQVYADLHRFNRYVNSGVAPAGRRWR